MTTELEMNFFQCFGIEKRKKGYCDWDSWCPYEDLTCGNDCPYWKYDDEQYPEITDRKLLELICILSTAIKLFKIPPHLNTEGLKKHILQSCINYQESINTRVRKLFEEE